MDLQAWFPHKEIEDLRIRLKKIFQDLHQKYAQFSG